MPKMDVDQMQAFLNKKRAADEKKKGVGHQDTAPAAGDKRKSPERAVPITVIPADDLVVSPNRPKKHKSHDVTGPSSRPGSPLTICDTFKPKDVAGAYLSMSGIGALARNMTDFLGRVATLTDGRDSLRTDIQKYRKAISDGEKTLAATLEGKKKAEEELDRSRTEVIRLTSRLASVEDSLKVANSNLAAAQTQISELESKADKLTMQIIEQFQAGYEAALSHVKVLSPGTDVGNLRWNTKIVDGKQVTTED